MKPIVHCLFEQSGTFKKEARKMGLTAYDYDIEDNFKQTDYKCDLFREIEDGYFGRPSVFDNVNPRDIVLAFFPCTMFSAVSMFWLRGDCKSEKGWSDERKVSTAMARHSLLAEFYQYFCHLYLLALRKGFRLVIENPYALDHYLKRFFPVKASLVIDNRREYGDYYVKPTQFWFVNFLPRQNVFFQPIDSYPFKRIGKEANGFSRSMISPCFASLFLRCFVLDLKDIPQGYVFEPTDE